MWSKLLVRTMLVALLIGTAGCCAGRCSRRCRPRHCCQPTCCCPAGHEQAAESADPADDKTQEEMFSDPPPVGPGTSSARPAGDAEAEWDDDSGAAAVSGIEQWPPPRAREPIQPE